jgi:hypothetical protein
LSGTSQVEGLRAVEKILRPVSIPASSGRRSIARPEQHPNRRRTEMKYLLMIYSNENVDAKKTPAELATMMQDYRAFTQEAKDRKVYIGGEPLTPTSTATTVRVRNGKTMTTDGPFAETKEQLGGYYLLDCANLDEAIELAAKIPHAAEGSIEVRPIMAFDQTATA